MILKAQENFKSWWILEWNFSILCFKAWQLLIFIEQTDALVDSSMIHFNKDLDEDKGEDVGWKGWASRIQTFLESYENKTGKACDEANKPGSDETCLFQVLACTNKIF